MGGVVGYLRVRYSAFRGLDGLSMDYSNCVGGEGAAIYAGFPGVVGDIATRTPPTNPQSYYNQNSRRHNQPNPHKYNDCAPQPSRPV